MISTHTHTHTHTRTHTHTHKHTHTHTTRSATLGVKLVESTRNDLCRSLNGGMQGGGVEGRGVVCGEVKLSLRWWFEGRDVVCGVVKLKGVVLKVEA